MKCHLESPHSIPKATRFIMSLQGVIRLQQTAMLNGQTNMSTAIPGVACEVSRIDSCVHHTFAAVIMP